MPADSPARTTASPAASDLIPFRITKRPKLIVAVPTAQIASLLERDGRVVVRLLDGLEVTTGDTMTAVANRLVRLLRSS